MFNSLWPMDCSMPGFPVLPRVCSNSCPLIQWCHPTHLILCHHLLLPSVFPCIRVFSSELALCISWPKYWSFSFHIVLLVNMRVDFLEDWLVWSPCSPGDFKESYTAPQFKSISYLVLSFLYGPTFTSVCYYWKKHSFWLYRPLLAKRCLWFLIRCLGVS